KRTVRPLQRARNERVFVGRCTAEVETKIAFHVRIGVAHAIAVVLCRDSSQRIRLVTEPVEIALSNLAEHTCEPARFATFFFHVRTLEEHLADLLVGQGVHLFETDYEHALHTTACERIE